jgi:transcriptional regulator with XRE-family HTH domain
MASWSTLKSALANRGMKVYEFADAVGVKPQTAYNWIAMQKRPKAKRVPRIAEVLTNTPEAALELQGRLLEDLARA